MQGLAGFQHDEVGDVHEGVDRPQADRSQAVLQPEGGGAHCDALDHPRGIAGAVVGRFDRHGRQPPGRRVAFVQTQGRAREPGALNSGDLARHPDDAQAVGAVGGQVDFQYGVGQTESAVERLAHGRGPVQDHDLAGGGAERQFRGAAEHALGALAPQDSGLEDGTVRHDRSRERHGREGVRACVGSAADDGYDAPARVDLADLESIGGGVRVHGEDAPDPDRLEEGEPVHDRVHGQAHPGQRLGQVGRGHADGRVLREPAQANFHREE